MGAAALTRPVALAGKSSERPVVPIITGTALLTPLGRTAQETWDALLAGKFITDHARAAGEFDRASPRIIQMAQHVARAAMGEAGWSENDDFATVVGTSKGSVESWLPAPQHMSSLAYETGGFPLAGLADIASHLAVGYGPKLTLSGACASGLIALIRAAMLIQSGQAQRVLVVAAEASVHPLFLASFKRLGILAAREIGCRPFDQSRDGFLMSESAAAVCLESAPGGADILACHGHASVEMPRIAIEHYAMGADASHLTSPDPNGRVLRHLINKVTQNHSVDLIHAHGTATLANDPIEIAAIGSALAPQSHTPCLYSHKAALGHSLGAAGLVSIVLNALAHRHGAVPPNVRTTRPLPSQIVKINRATNHTPIHRSIALAAGFGGAIAAVSLVTL